MAASNYFRCHNLLFTIPIHLLYYVLCIYHFAALGHILFITQFVRVLEPKIISMTHIFVFYLFLQMLEAKFDCVKKNIPKLYGNAASENCR